MIMNTISVTKCMLTKYFLIKFGKSFRTVRKKKKKSFKNLDYPDKNHYSIIFFFVLLLSAFGTLWKMLMIQYIVYVHLMNN